jgi:hypothetical protein
MFINPLSQVLGSSYSCLIHTLIQQRRNFSSVRNSDLLAQPTINSICVTTLIANLEADFSSCRQLTASGIPRPTSIDLLGYND